MNKRGKFLFQRGTVFARSLARLLFEGSCKMALRGESEMCGIKVSENNTYVVAPKVGGKVTHAACEYNGIYGRVRSEWTREGDKTRYCITVPANSNVRAILPDGEHILTAGEHEIIT